MSLLFSIIEGGLAVFGLVCLIVLGYVFFVALPAPNDPLFQMRPRRRSPTTGPRPAV